jgi:8-amino-7-oxononanoate synthase
LTLTEAGAEPWAERDGRRLLNLSSNNYLGLAGDSRLVGAARVGAARGAGSGSSRLVAAHDLAHATLEEKLAAFKGTERAVVLGSGFLANVGTIAALLDGGAAVVSDRLNHASIIDGCRLSGAEILRYEHCDLDDLERQLARASRPGRRVLVVTDTVFSMDGDVAPLAGIVELKERYGAALLIDDAHGTGVLGPDGAGAAHEAGVAERVDLQLGTFSKAFGVYGAYVAGAEPWIGQLVSACRPLIFSTGLPPAVVAAIDAAIEIVRAADDRRAQLRRKATVFRERLQAGGVNTGRSATQIVPAIVGESTRTLALALALRERGLLTIAIRPPTVPAGQARIRFSLMATHDDTDLDAAAAAVVEEANRL